MDRIFNVVKNGQVLASLDFTYTDETHGSVVLMVNTVTEIADGMWTAIPHLMTERYFQHDYKPANLGELRHFDLDYLSEITEFKSQLTDDVSHKYQNVNKRFLITAGQVLGIADVELDMNTNHKQIQFISTVRMNNDFQSGGEFMEPSALLIRREVEQRFGAFAQLDIKRL